MNERGLVEVPENAIRDEPIAFGLTGVQLGICGLAVAVAAVLNLLPVWEPIRVVLIVALAGPIAIAAALPIRGEPAYRWLLRAARYRRGHRLWQATITRPDKSQLSAERDTAGLSVDPSDGGACQTDDNQEAAAVAETSSEDLPREATGGRSAPRERARMTEAPLLRPHPLRPEPAGSDEPSAAQRRERDERPSIVPHLLPVLRIASFLSFAGGVGKSTLGVEVATFVAAHARYLTLEGDERRLRVLLLDASRLTISVAGIRLGLDGQRLSKSAAGDVWREPAALDSFVIETPSGVDLLSAPAHPMTEGSELRLEPEREIFRASHVEDVLDALPGAGYQLVVVDLGSHLEEAHLQLIDRSDVLLGVVRPTLESLPDVHRLATFLRSVRAARKLVFVANMATDDALLRRHAHAYELGVGATVPASASFTSAAERGEPAWRLDPTLVPPIRRLASHVWPLLDERETAPHGHRILDPVRRLAARGARTTR